MIAASHRFRSGPIIRRKRRKIKRWDGILFLLLPRNPHTVVFEEFHSPINTGYFEGVCVCVCGSG